MSVPSGTPYWTELSCTAVGNQLSDPALPGYDVVVSAVLNLNGWSGHSGTTNTLARVYIDVVQAWNPVTKQGLIWTIPSTSPTIYSVLNAATPIYGQLIAGTYTLIVVGEFGTLLSSAIPYGVPTGSGTLVISGVMPPVPVAPGPAAFLERWDQQVVTWTGDGTNGRLIPTTFGLDEGVVAIWVFSQTDQTCCFRHNLATMTGSLKLGSEGFTTQAGKPIGSFLSGGFTVGIEVGDLNASANTNLQPYTAIVLRDTTRLNSYMQVGIYTGVQAEVFTPNVAPGTSQMTIVAGRTFVGSDTGRSYFISTAPTAGGNLTYIDSTHALGNGGWTGVSGTVSGTIYADNRTITTASSLPPRAMWVFGRFGVYRSDLFPALGSVSLGNIAYAVTNQIKSFSGASFILGDDDNVARLNVQFAWVTFTFTNTDPIASYFKHFKTTGTGSPVTVSGLGFTPAFAVTREYDITVLGGLWKGPNHVGTDSSRFNEVSQGTTGITAFASGSLTLGVGAGASGKDIYGFALAASGAVLPPAYTPPSYPTTTSTDHDVVVSGVTAALVAAEGKGITLVVPDVEGTVVTTTGRWGLERFDIKRRREEHK